MKSEKIDKWLFLLKSFVKLPVVENNRTFMQISGYPHYENVCSNILSFYFESNNEHGLRDLCYQALLKCLKEDKGELSNESVVDVEREVNCNGKRLDLVLTSDSYVIGIENKIWHELNNDLKIYKKEIDNRTKNNDLTPICIVLGIRKETPSSGFISVTYKQFLKELKSLSGHYSIHANSKYVTYLHDFIKTIEDLQGENMKNEAHVEFFKENYQIIQELNCELGKYQKSLNGKVCELKSLIEIDDNKLNLWIYKKSVLVFDFLFNNEKLAIDLELNPQGWHGTIFSRTKKSRDFLVETLESSGVEPLRTDRERFVVIEEDSSIDLLILKGKVKQIVSQILSCD